MWFRAPLCAHVPFLSLVVNVCARYLLKTGGRRLDNRPHGSTLQGPAQSPSRTPPVPSSRDETGDWRADGSPVSLLWSPPQEGRRIPKSLSYPRRVSSPFLTRPLSFVSSGPRSRSAARRG